MTLSLVIMAIVVGILVWVNIKYRRELRRRAKLPLREQEALKREDENWLQRYGF